MEYHLVIVVIFLTFFSHIYLMRPLSLWIPFISIQDLSHSYKEMGPWPSVSTVLLKIYNFLVLICEWRTFNSIRIFQNDLGKESYERLSRLLHISQILGYYQGWFFATQSYLAANQKLLEDSRHTKRYLGGRELVNSQSIRVWLINLLNYV